MKQMQVLFSGRVQGVGFRYTVCRMAQSFGVTGFVRNLMDGDVEVLTEGSEQELIDFLSEIRDSHLGRHIRRERLHWAAATGAYDKFRVTY
ncbi:MAG: acylphosphatase [Verrucomicrobia bacterium]|nr:acylphosphatase [Verrucomicrobiota bacterium]